MLVGLVVYFWHATPEEQGTLDPKRPAYLHASAASLASGSGGEAVVVPSLARDGEIV